MYTPKANDEHGQKKLEEHKHVYDIGRTLCSKIAHKYFIVKSIFFVSD
jgi:hypothetical protein